MIHFGESASFHTHQLTDCCNIVRIPACDKEHSLSQSLFTKEEMSFLVISYIGTWPAKIIVCNTILPILTSFI